MVTNCGGGDPHLYNLREMIFFTDLLLLLVLVVIPVAIGYVLWRIFVTNRMRPGGTMMLGLDANSARYEELYGRTFPWRSLFTHAAVGVATFEFGVFVYGIVVN